MRSDFDSVTSQSGIHAGSDGYEITVKENTLLKGGLIDSVANADKNRLTTVTLAWEDMKNSADYKAGGLGISYASKDEGTRLNERGLTPSIFPWCKKIRFVWDARAIGPRIFICEEQWGAR